MQRNEIICEKLSSFNERTEIPGYSIGQRKSPPLFPSHVDNTDTNELEKSLKKDLIWAIMIDYDGIDDTIGFWTDFQRNTTDLTHQESLVEYSF